LNLFAWFIFLGAAFLEVGGDAVVRKGLRGSALYIVIAGFIMLGCYGLVVNLMQWDFSKLMGVYIAIFALISLLFGRFFFREMIPMSTWVGVGVIIMGGLIIQFGEQLFFE